MFVTASIPHSRDAGEQHLGIQNSKFEFCIYAG